MIIGYDRVRYRGIAETVIYAGEHCVVRGGVVSRKNDILPAECGGFANNHADVGEPVILTEYIPKLSYINVSEIDSP